LWQILPPLCDVSHPIVQTSWKAKSFVVDEQSVEMVGPKLMRCPGHASVVPEKGCQALPAFKLEISFFPFIYLKSL
jgi:hypothetical protein